MKIHIIILLTVLIGLGIFFYPRPSEILEISNDDSELTITTCSCKGIEIGSTGFTVSRTCLGIPTSCKTEVRIPTEADLEKFMKTVKKSRLDK